MHVLKCFGNAEESVTNCLVNVTEKVILDSSLKGEKLTTGERGGGAAHRGRGLCHGCHREHCVTAGGSGTGRGRVGDEMAVRLGPEDDKTWDGILTSSGENQKPRKDVMLT